VTSFDFKPIDCPKCGHLVWDGLTSAGVPVKLDVDRLNILDEIKTLQAGTATYQIHRTSTSFEVTRRTPARMRAVEPIVLARHTCSQTAFFFGAVAPDYFNRIPIETNHTDEVPF
jgi:hypothetical protein